MRVNRNRATAVVATSVAVVLLPLLTAAPSAATQVRPIDDPDPAADSQTYAADLPLLPDPTPNQEAQAGGGSGDEQEGLNAVTQPVAVASQPATDALRETGVANLNQQDEQEPAATTEPASPQAPNEPAGGGESSGADDSTDSEDPATSQAPPAAESGDSDSTPRVEGAVPQNERAQPPAQAERAAPAKSKATSKSGTASSPAPGGTLTGAANQNERTPALVRTGAATGDIAGIALALMAGGAILLGTGRHRRAARAQSI